MNICIKLCWSYPSGAVLIVAPNPYSPPRSMEMSAAQKRNIPHDEWISSALPTWGRADCKGLPSHV